jgi:hypothetical protein
MIAFAVELVVRFIYRFTERNLEQASLYAGGFDRVKKQGEVRF